VGTYAAELGIVEVKDGNTSGRDLTLVKVGASLLVV